MFVIAWHIGFDSLLSVIIFGLGFFLTFTRDLMFYILITGFTLPVLLHLGSLCFSATIDVYCFSLRQRQMTSLNNNLVDKPKEYYVPPSMQFRSGGHLFYKIICVRMFPLLHWVSRSNYYLECVTKRIREQLWQCHYSQILGIIRSLSLDAENIEVGLISF